MVSDGSDKLGQLARASVRKPGHVRTVVMGKQKL